MYLRNCWNVAGWSREYVQSLRARTLLGEKVVFYRQRDEKSEALAVMNATHARLFRLRLQRRIDAGQEMEVC